MIKNREQAARILSKKLIRFKGKVPLVLGIPRGAMPMARIIAKNLSGELNAVLVHKIPAPDQPELAIGAVGISGEIYQMPIAEELNISADYIQKQAEFQKKLLQKRKKTLHLPDYRCFGRIVILVDDGVATGATALAAIREIKKENPLKLILAVAVIAKSSKELLRSEVDELIAIEEPNNFFSVSQFFEEFPQVSDQEVIRLLQGSAKDFYPSPST